MNRVDGKAAVVPGAAKGIGRATCELLAREGAMVAALDRDEGALAETVAGIEGVVGAARGWELDVTDEGAVERVMAEVDEHFGGLHVLVNNAGIAGTDRPTHEVTAEQWRRVMAVNVEGVFYCTKHAILYAGDGIRVNSVHPGFVWTPMVEEALAKRGEVDEQREAAAALHLLGRIGEAGEVAPAILFLASDEASFVTGSELIVDGGYTAR